MIQSARMHYSQHAFHQQPLVKELLSLQLVQAI